MELYQGIVLGILQGLTEFLPVSSSGHLVLGQIFFGMTESQLDFDISVHVGTLLAVLVVYFADIRSMLSAVFRLPAKVTSFSSAQKLFREEKEIRLAGCILIGSVPTAVIGIVLKQFEHFLFSSQALVGCMLLVTGTLLWISRRFYAMERPQDSNVRPTVSQAIMIGVSQGFAVIPGISRSGTTIAVGMFLGLNRHMAARFSFLLSVPAIVGAQILGIKDMVETGASINNVTIWATLVSFVVGLAALKLLLKLVHSGKFHLFAPYCWALGTVVLLFAMI